MQMLHGLATQAAFSRAQWFASTVSTRLRHRFAYSVQGSIHQRAGWSCDWCLPVHRAKSQRFDAVIEAWEMVLTGLALLWLTWNFTGILHIEEGFSDTMFNNTIRWVLLTGMRCHVQGPAHK